MLGLQVEIMQRKKNKYSSQDEKFSYSYLSKLLGLTYQGMRKKFNSKAFTLDEAWAIFKSLVPQDKQTLEMFQYLFIEEF